MKSLLKIIVNSAILIFVVTSLYLGYRYVHEVSQRVPAKGGTIVEGVIGRVNYMPYTSTRKTDKFYQSLLFKGCAKAVNSGGKLIYENDLCEISTRDYKNYFIALPNSYRWIDYVEFGINDLLFTYQAILKDNIWKIEELNSYNKTEISKVDESTIKVSFPKQSIDNMLFFLNPLLPEHVLSGKNLDYYLKTFAKQPIYISCAVLDLVKSHSENIVFNISQCRNFYPQILQIKQFKDNAELSNYFKSPKPIVDYVLVDSSEVNSGLQNLPGLSGNELATNTLYTLFFNVNSISDNVRRGLAHSMSLVNYPNLLYHNTLFSFIASTGISLKDIISNQTLSAGTGVSGGIVSTFPFLPKNIWIFGKNKFKEYYLDEFRDKYLIQFKFDTKYDKITIAANSNYEFTPDSYDPETKTCAYNLSLQFKNIKKGVNTYTIYGYLAGKQYKLLTMKLHYGVKPQILPAITKKTNYTIIYLDEPNSNVIVNTLKNFFVDQGIDSYMSFVPYESLNEFEGKLSSKAYDMVLLPLDLGLKNDLSALFSDTSTINPSQYSNDRVIQLLQRYTNGDKQATNEILSIYQKIYPFVMLGSLKQTLYVKNVYPFQLGTNYNNISFRYLLINSLKTYETIVLEKKVLLSGTNILNFLKRELNK